jgi:hypothetical protein
VTRHRGDRAENTCHRARRSARSTFESNKNVLERPSGTLSETFAQTNPISTSCHSRKRVAPERRTRGIKVVVYTMASACAFSAVHALARVTRRAPRLASRAIRPSRFSSRASSRLSAAGTNLDVAFEKTKHNEELSCTRDTMVGGCSECTMPNENERAVVLADAALRNHSRLLQMEQGAKTKTKGESSKMSLRVLVVGAETGKLVSELLAKGATHVLVIDHSQKMLDRSSEAFDALGVAGNAIGARFLRADVSDVPAYQGPFDAIIFNDTLRQEFDPSDSLRRSVLLTRPGARVVVSEREGDDGGERDSVRLDLVSMTRDLPVQAIDDNPSAGKTMCAEADFDSGDSSQDDSSSFDSTCSSNVWTYEVPPLFSLANPVAMTAPVVAGFGRGSKVRNFPNEHTPPSRLPILVPEGNITSDCLRNTRYERLTLSFALIVPADGRADREFGTRVANR